MRLILTTSSSAPWWIVGRRRSTRLRQWCGQPVVPMQFRSRTSSTLSSMRLTPTTSSSTPWWIAGRRRANIPSFFISASMVRAYAASRVQAAHAPQQNGQNVQYAIKCKADPHHVQFSPVKEPKAQKAPVQDGGLSKRESASQAKPAHTPSEPLRQYVQFIKREADLDHVQTSPVVEPKAPKVNPFVKRESDQSVQVRVKEEAEHLKMAHCMAHTSGPVCSAAERPVLQRGLQDKFKCCKRMFRLPLSSEFYWDEACISCRYKAARLGW